MIKILYGVQGTGQGHISRARAMAEALAKRDVEVTWLFSGRPKEKFFDMEPFGDFQYRQGLTFVTEAGKLQYIKTALHNNIFKFLNDLRTLNLEPYDVIVTDYEPVTAWAAKTQRRKLIGIGHQYAFGDKTPKAGDSWIQKTVMQRFAPVDVNVGLHWAPFSNTVLPPILDLPRLSQSFQGEQILVYLPFEDQAAITDWLQQFSGYQFVQYSSALPNQTVGNVAQRTACIEGFKRDLARSRGVICNSGFELISECLQWGKPVLTKPLAGQMEQLSNAEALSQLGYARVMHSLCEFATRDWLENPPLPPELHFKNVAKRLAEWLEGGAQAPVEVLCTDLWQNKTHTENDKQGAIEHKDPSTSFEIATGSSPRPFGAVDTAVTSGLGQPRGLSR